MSETSRALFQALDSMFAVDADPTAAARDGAFDRPLWELLEEHGYTSVDPRETDLADFVEMAAAVGKHAVALPLVDAGLAHWVAGTARLALPAGVCVAAVGDRRDSLSASSTDGQTWTVSGAVHRVPWGRHARAVVALTDTPQGPCVVVLDPPDEIEPHENLAGEPRDTLVFRHAVVAPDRWADAGDLDRFELRARGVLLRTASAVGAMERVLDLVVDYSRQREQFGRPIGSNQAVQHHLVLIYEAAVASRAALEAASEGDSRYRRLMVAGARVTVAEQSGLLAQSAHQVLGAIGVTEEHALQRYTRRLWSWQDEFGSASEWAEYLGDRLLFAGSPGAWPVVTPPHSLLDERGLGQAVPW